MSNHDLFACGLMKLERLSNEMARVFYVERPRADGPDPVR
jgi:hypothetical protein